MKKSNLDDLFVVSLAREMRNDDRVFVGSNQLDVGMAAHLARQLWAPKLKFWASGSAVLGSNGATYGVGLRGYDDKLVNGRESFFWQARAFDEMGLRSPVCFAGGLQVDSRGNANMSGIIDGDRWKLRGPGSAGLPSLTTWAERFYVLVPDHQPRSLVDVCSRISVLGDPVARRSLGLNPSSMAAVITPLARFEPTDAGLVLTEVADGIELEEVLNRTGFEVRLAENVRKRQPMSREEADTLKGLQSAASLNQDW